MASRAVLHPKRRAASPPSPGTSPGTGTSPPVTPPKSPNPRAKKAPRGSRATAAGATGRTKKPPSCSDTKPTRPKKSNKTSKSLREAAKEALERCAKEALETTARPPRSAEVEKTSKTSVAEAASAQTNVGSRNDGHSPPERSPRAPKLVGDASGDARGDAARPAWDGRPHNPRAAAASVTRPRAYEPTNRKNGSSHERKSGSLRLGTTVIRRDPSVFPTVGTAGTDAKTPTSTPPRAPTVAPLTLNISGDASVAQKALTQKREDEKATKAAAAAAARARGARARRVGAQTRRGNVRTPIARVDRRGSVFAFVAFAHDPTEISESRFVRRVPTAHASRRVRVRVRLRAPARAGVPIAPRRVLRRAGGEAAARGGASADDGVRRALSAQRDAREGDVSTRVRAV